MNTIIRKRNVANVGVYAPVHCCPKEFYAGNEECINVYRCMSKCHYHCCFIGLSKAKGLIEPNNRGATILILLSKTAFS